MAQLPLDRLRSIAAAKALHPSGSSGRAPISQVDGHGVDLWVPVVVQAPSPACAATRGPAAGAPDPATRGRGWRALSHPGAWRHEGADGGPPLRNPGRA